MFGITEGMCKDWKKYEQTNYSNLQKLQEVIKSGKAIAFIGAGCSMSKPLEYPSWAGLTQKMLDEIAATKPGSKPTVKMLRKNKDLLYVAGECKNLMGVQYYAFLGREFAPRTKESKKHTPEHETIIDLPFYNYITSNYDPCLDYAYTARKSEPSRSFTYKNKQMLAEFCASTIEPQEKIFHIHGRYDSLDDITLTQDDYNIRYQEDLISYLRGIIMARPFVFIGSGVKEPDFLGIMKFIGYLFKGFQDKHYAIIPCPNGGYAQNEAGKLADTYNILPVFYANLDGKHAERADILKDILSYCDVKAVKKLAAVEISPESKEYELTQYKVKLNAELTNLRILDMSRPLNLADIYIKICLRENVNRYISESEAHQYGKLDEPEKMLISRIKTEHVSKSMFIEEALKGHRKIVILGDPGAGKTTLLKHITLQLADKGVEGVKGIPIFVTLRDYINKFKPDLLNYLDDDLSRRYGFSHARTYLEEEFKSGNVAIFFDGLDEISGGEQGEASANYNKVVEVINNVATRYNNCHIAVTCRKAGWRGGINNSFSIFEVLDFTPEDITNFVDKWFRGEPEKAKELNRELGRKTRVKSLAGNPLLLSFVCILYGKFRTFPERRVTLHERCVDVLLNDWDESRGIERRSIFGQDKKKLLLQDIAYRFFIEGKRYFKEDELIRVIQECLPDLYLRQEDATDILKEISANHGLLKEQADGWYGFIHLTVQEYFAACEIHERRDYKVAIKNSFKPWWEEVILLLAGIGDSAELIKGLSKKADDIFDHNLRLAGRCLAEKPTLKGGVQLREAVLNKLKGVVSKGEYELNTLKAISGLAENGEFGFLLGVICDEKTDNYVKIAIAYMLDKIRDSTIVTKLMPLLRDKKTDWRVTRGIARVLGKTGSSSIVPELMAIFRDDKTNINVRTMIVIALVNLGDSAIVGDLIAILRDNKTDWRVISSIAIGLGKIDDSNIIAELMPLLHDDKTDNHVKVGITEALGYIGDSSIVPELMPFLLDRKIDNNLRGSIAEALGCIGDSSIVPEFMLILSNSKTNSSLRCKIAEALGKVGDSSIVPNLMPLLRNCKTYWTIRRSIAKALGKIGDSSIVPNLISLLRDVNTDDDVRNQIAETLGIIADSSIVPDLMSMIDDVDSYIWRNIVQAIGKLANTKEHCEGLLKLRSKYIEFDTLHTALYQISRRIGVTIDKSGNIIDI
ncbi:signal transduction protein with Nacht domain protein [Candidatus Magnetobacterium bavaricum]|uniref:Signal transduction protein with Nacht domain protein n=1 Tax=Candidatus Magnetobacterium bavaricum TaxID=29290 RepID=A0A0F3GKV8_9BACT|nr:signal transduction protein with Nacht domain protein [Candidatus Magnetobacterium bavaricum]